MDSDPFFLDWGSSVNVNEDLRHTIQAEINSLDKDLHKLDQTNRAEERTASLIQRDYSHAQAELIALNTEGLEEKENATMNEQLQIRLGDSLEKEVVNVISNQKEQRASSSSTPHLDLGDEASSKEDVTVVNLGMAEYAMKRSQEIKYWMMTNLAKKASNNEGLSKVEELQIQLKDADGRIVKEQRNQTVWNDDVEIRQKEFMAESQRLQSVKDSLAKRRKNVGDFTQQSTDCKRSLDSTKESNKRGEAKWNSELEESASDISEVANQVKNIAETKLSIENRIDMLNRQFIEREDILGERLIIKNNIAKTHDKLNSHRAREEELLQLIAEAKEAVEKKQKDVDILGEEMATVGELCALNDKEEVEVLNPAKEEYPSLLANSENVSKQILDLQNQSSAAKKNGELEIAASKASLEEIKKQVLEKVMYNEEKMNVIKACIESRDEVTQTATEEIAQHNTLKKQFEESCEVHEKEIAKEEDDRAKLRAKRGEAKKLERICEEFALEKLRCGVQIIQETEAKVASLQGAM